MGNEEGLEMYKIAQEIFPIYRSITGNGVRKTLYILKQEVPGLQIQELPSGTKVFDWTIPDEWNIEDAYVEDEAGTKIIDFQKNNLHIIGYSVPMDQVLNLNQLLEITYTEPSQPDVIPYVTSYYTKRSGFCMAETQKISLSEGKYHAVINSSFKNGEDGGKLTYGEYIIRGRTDQEILISTYICHPSMANNECSGPVLAVKLAQWIGSIQNRKYTYRILWLPETIGSIAYLSQHYKYLKNKIIAGFVLSCVGDDRTFSFVSSRKGDTLTDRILRHVMKYEVSSYKEYTFLERGSDERQYNAPGIDLPVCSFSRSKYGEYPEYHTSADNMDLISPEGLQGGFDTIKKCIQILEHNERYRVRVLCEPQLGKRGLYPSVSKKGNYGDVKDITNFIAYADGINDLLEISELIKVPCIKLIEIAQELLKADLINLINE